MECYGWRPYQLYDTDEMDCREYSIENAALSILSNV